MPYSVFVEGKVWDVHIPRKVATTLIPVSLRRFDQNNKRWEYIRLCQISDAGRFGWTVIVAGDMVGRRMVEGFKTRMAAIKYAINSSIYKNIMGM